MLLVALGTSTCLLVCPERTSSIVTVSTSPSVSSFLILACHLVLFGIRKKTPQSIHSMIHRSIGILDLFELGPNHPLCPHLHHGAFLFNYSRRHHPLGLLNLSRSFFSLFFPQVITSTWSSHRCLSAIVVGQPQSISGPLRSSGRFPMSRRYYCTR